MRKKRRKNKREKKKREEKLREERRREENRREEKEEKKVCVKERQPAFYHKNMFKNTFNFKINFIVILYGIFENKNSCPNCLAYIF